MAIEIVETMTEEAVKELRGDDSKLFKVNLRHDSFSSNGEGVWAVARVEDGWERYTRNEKEVAIQVVCLNDSLSGPEYGDVFIAMLRGEHRPASVDVTDIHAIDVLRSEVQT